MKSSKIILALIITLAFVLTAIAVPAPVEGAVTQLELVPGKYTDSNIYVPGEAMTIVIHADEGDVYQVFHDIGDGSPIGTEFTIDSTGLKNIYWEVPNAADGNYSIIVRLPNGAVEITAEFWIRGYSFNIETDRSAYLAGDIIKVFWTANNLKDQTLPTYGVGKIKLWKQEPIFGNLTEIVEQHEFNNSAGSVSFTLPLDTESNYNYYVEGWFNSSRTQPIRKQYSKAIFDVKLLGVIVDLDKNQYSVGSLLRINVNTFATDNQAYPSIVNDTAEPGCDISIEIYAEGIEIDNIPSGLKTDAHGLVEYIVPLDPNTGYTDGTTYNIEVTAQKGIFSITDIVSFEITSSSSITVVLDFNRGQYASGETLFINATASSIGDISSPSYTYILEIRNNDTAGTLFSRDTQSTGDFSFEIPDNFEGWLWVQVTVDDGAGNSASIIQQVRVSYAIVLVNVNNENYNAEDELSISYEVIGTLLGEPDTFYVIYDKEGSVVKEGTATNGSFTFTVPSAPSDSYEFAVFASAGGRVVHGSDSANLFSGYVLILNFNKAFYEPGETMAIDYRIIVMGNADMPTTFTITYGLINGPEASLQTGEQTGRLMYSIPDNIDQGNQIFMASCDFGVSSTEVVIVDEDASLLKYLEISGIPLFGVFILVLLLFTMYVTFRTRSRVKSMQKQGLTAPSSKESSLVPKRTQDASSASQFQCVECGDPIEITTSRRPIEVMCPHCGEIQHIE